MMATLEKIAKNGKVITIEVAYSETVVDEIRDVDGDMVRTGERKIERKAMLIFSIDGKEAGRCGDPAFWQIIDVERTSGVAGAKAIWGIPGFCFGREFAEEVEAFLNSVIESGKSAEAEEIRAAEIKAEDARVIGSAKEIIAAAEAQEDIPEQAEARRRMKLYNEVMNEGESGFVPHIVSREEYEAAKDTIRRLR